MAYEEAKTGLAKSLRRKMTAAERRLWSRLRKDRFSGLRWLAQEPVGPFVAEFYCSTARLVVELDGNAHVLAESRDRKRDEWMKEQGITVLRFPNWAVMHELGTVLDTIFCHCSGHLE